MFQINRSVAIIRPKQPFVDWANSIADEDEKYSVHGFNTDCSVILLQEYDSDEDAEAFIKDVFQDVFEIELSSWIVVEEMWPKTEHTKCFWNGLMLSFIQWFSILFKMILRKNLMNINSFLAP